MLTIRWRTTMLQPDHSQEALHDQIDPGPYPDPDLNQETEIQENEKDQ